MEQRILRIAENTPLTKDVYRMALEGDVAAVERPGQFINIKLDGFYLRRPISVCDKTDGRLTILYKTVGRGTEHMAALKEGDTLDVLLGLGNGFDVSCAGDEPLLIGGGLGAAPLYWLAKELRAQGKRPGVVLGFKTAGDVVYENEFLELGCFVAVVTEDGTYKGKGFVTDALIGFGCSYFYACGPEPMLKAVYETCRSEGELSFERRMGCGFGACMGCSCETIAGSKRICRDGPIMRKEEIRW